MKQIILVMYLPNFKVCIVVTKVISNKDSLLERDGKTYLYVLFFFLNILIDFWKAVSSAAAFYCIVLTHAIPGCEHAICWM